MSGDEFDVDVYNAVITKVRVGIQSGSFTDDAFRISEFVKGLFPRKCLVTIMDDIVSLKSLEKEVEGKHSGIF